MRQSIIRSWQTVNDKKGNHCRKICVGKHVSWGYREYL